MSGQVGQRRGVLSGEGRELPSSLVRAAVVVVAGVGVQDVPGVGLVLQGIWAILLVFTGTYNELLDFVMFTVLVFYVITVIGLFVLRAKRPDTRMRSVSGDGAF